VQLQQTRPLTPSFLSAYYVLSPPHTRPTDLLQSARRGSTSADLKWTGGQRRLETMRALGRPNLHGALTARNGALYAILLILG